MGKPKFFQWFAYDVRTVATDCSGMSGEQEATYHRLMRYLWDEGPQMEAVLRGRSFGNWDAISHCFTDHGTGLSLGWLEEYRAKANGTSERQRSNRGSTTVQPRLNNGKSTELPSREEEEEQKEKKERVRVPRQAIDLETFRSMCNDAVKENATLLSEGERKPFFAYWTETNAAGKHRFQGEKYFDIARRMGTWQAKANNGAANGFKSTAEPMFDGTPLSVLEKFRLDFEKEHGRLPGGGDKLPKGYSRWKGWI